MLLEVQNLVKKYKDGYCANQNISFSIEKGEVYGILGPSGAGKTTLINQIMGLTSPTSGSIKLNNEDIVKYPYIARKLCSYQPQTYVPINGMTPLQAMEIFGRLRGGNKAKIKARANEIVESLQLNEWINKPCERLSGGIKRLVSFSLSIIVPTQLVILDEPTNDVDPIRRKLLWNMIRELTNDGTTVLLVTHNVLEAEKVVNRLAIIDKGTLLVKGTPAEFKDYNDDDLIIEVMLNQNVNKLDCPEYLKVTYSNGKRLRIVIQQHMLIEGVKWIQVMKAQKIVDEFNIGPSSLEDAYLHIIKNQNK